MGRKSRLCLSTQHSAATEHFEAQPGKESFHEREIIEMLFH